MAPIDSKITDVLLLGDHRQILTVIRSLARAGYRSIVGHTGKERYGSWSRYCSETWVHPALEDDSDRFIESLNQYLNKACQGTVLFPIGDEEIRVLTRHGHALPEHVSVIMPRREIVELCHDKVAMARFIDDTGIPQAPYEIIRAGKSLAESADRIGYPCVIRPSDQFIRLKGEKVSICNSFNDVGELVNDPDVCNHVWIVQQYVHGPRHNLYFIASQGNLERYVETRALRTDRIDGTGLAVDSISIEPSSEIVAACKKIIKRLDYTGLGCAQFLMDEAGKLKCFLEINPRLGAAIALPQACGVDFPRLAIEQLQGHEPPNTVAPDSYRRGVRFGWFYGDLLGFYRTVRSDDVRVVDAGMLIFAMLRTLLFVRVHPTWNIFDPLPTCAAYLRLVNLGIHKILRIGSR